MSMMSEICAEHHREIVQAAIAKEVFKVRDTGTTDYTKVEVIEILERVLKYCNENISE